MCREVLEEIGIDLKSEDYLQLGQLDEREIASIKDNRLLMILVPFGKQKPQEGDSCLNRNRSLPPTHTQLTSISTSDIRSSFCAM